MTLRIQSAAVAAPLLALLGAQYTHAIAAHAPLDLLAYPAFAVRLRPEWPISNSSAAAILAANSEEQISHRTFESHKDVAQIQQLLQTDGGRVTGVAVSHPFLLRSAGNGQAYLCSVPQLQAVTHGPEDHSKKDDASTSRTHPTPEERSKRRRKNEEDKKLAFERGLALLEPLKGHCLYLTQGWFTYAFCHGSEIRQFHGIRVNDGRGTGIAEDPTQDSYTLGLWSSRATEDEGLVDTKKGRALGSLREILESEDKEAGALDIFRGPAKGDDDEVLSDEKRYLVQRWSGGTLCDKTGVDRKVEVQFHCNTQSGDRIFLIRETAICEYVIVIHTPRLCGEPIFVGSRGSAAESAAEKRRKAVSNIECRPVVKDELLISPSNGGKSSTAQIASTEAMTQVDSKMETPPEPRDTDVAEGSSPDSEENPSNNVAKDHTESDAKSDASQSDTSEANIDEEDDTHHDRSDGRDDDLVMESYVLVVDPETGEVLLESDSDASSISLQDLANEAQQGGGTDQLVKMLKKAMENALQGMVQNREGENVDAEQGQNQPSPSGAAAAEDVQGLPKPASLDEQKAANPGSRMKQAGTHNHAAVVEQFVKNQLRHQRAQGYPQHNHKHHHTQGGHAGKGSSKVLGSSQHRDLKKAFAAKVDHAEDSERKEEQAHDEL